MVIRDHIGNVLPATHNVHILYPWGTNSRMIALQPKVALDKQQIAQQLHDWIKQLIPGNNIIGYIITRGDDIHVYIDGGYAYNFIQHNPELINQLEPGDAKWNY